MGPYREKNRIFKLYINPKPQNQSKTNSFQNKLFQETNYVSPYVILYEIIDLKTKQYSGITQKMATIINISPRLIFKLKNQTAYAPRSLVKMEGLQLQNLFCFPVPVSTTTRKNRKFPLRIV